MSNVKIEQFYNKNQFVITEEKKVTFQSYNSTIAVLNRKELTLGFYWDYSKTTMKHLYLFLQDYVLLNDEIKNILKSKNKRKAIQDLIDNGSIQYDENMK